MAKSVITDKINAAKAKVKAKAPALIERAKTDPKGLVAETTKAIKTEAKKAAVNLAAGVGFAIALRAARTRLGYSQAQAAAATFLSRRSINAFERGRAPKFAAQSGILTLLGMAKAIDKAKGK